MTIDPTLGHWPGLRPELAAKIQYVSQRLMVDADLLAAVIAFETGKTWSPAARNKLSGATGLIQFIEPTAKHLGTSTAELAQMSDIEQMYYVEKMLRPMHPFNDAESVYMSVFAPKYRYDEPDTEIYSLPSKAYVQNKALDWDGSGAITIAEAAKPIKALYEQARKQQGKIPFPQTAEVGKKPAASKSESSSGGAPLLVVLLALGAAAAAWKKKKR